MYKLITSNMYLGANDKGIQDGISILKMKKVLDDTIDINVNYPAEIPVGDDNLKYLSFITEHLTKLHSIFQNELDKETIPVLIGGDHSISIASVAHTLDSFEEVGLIWIDAHADINTAEITNSGHIHGMSVAALMGIGPEALKNPFKRKIYLKPENIVYIGLRHVEEAEMKMIQDLGIYNISSDQVKKDGITKIMERINSYLNQRGIKNLHVSYDLDSGDPSETPGVTTAVPDGLTLDETREIFTTLYRNFSVRGLDIVEFNPKRDFEDKTVAFLENILQLSLSNLE